MISLLLSLTLLPYPFMLKEAMNLPDLAPNSALINTLLYVGLTLLIAVLVNNVLRSLIRVPKHFDNRRARSYISIVRSLISILVYIIAFYIILLLFGINIVPLLASAGIASVILGWGAGSIIKDFITGFFLLSQDSVITGDYVKIDQAEGYVESIKFRTFMLRSLSGELYIIPNGLVGTIVNFSTRKSTQFIDFPVKADQDIERVFKAMDDAFSQLQKDKELGASVFPGSTINGIENFELTGSMIVRATVVTSLPMRLDVGRKYRYLVKKEFEKYKISFA